MLDLSTAIQVGLIFSAAGLICGLCGFGFSLLAVGILSALLGPRLAIPLDLVAAAASCFSMAWILRRQIVIKDVIGIIVISTLFVPLGTIYLRSFDPSLIMRTLGVLILCTSLISILKLQSAHLFTGRPYRWIAAALAGLLAGAFNTPGPPMVLYAYNCPWPLRRAIANLQLIFSVMTFIVAASFIAAGLLTIQITLWGLIYTPFVVLFVWLGTKISKRLPLPHLTFIVNLVLLILGLNLIIRG